MHGAGCPHRYPNGRQYLALPPTVRQQLLAELRVLALDLFDLLPLATAVENVVDSSPHKYEATG